MSNKRVLRLRISWNPWLTPYIELSIVNELKEIFKNGAELVEHRRLGERLLKVIGGGKTAYMRKPTEQHPDWDLDVGPIRRTWKEERALRGEKLASNPIFFSSWHKPPLNIREVVAAVDCRKFETLPKHIQHMVNIAWMGLKQDRNLRSTALENGFSLFLLTATQDTRALARMEQTVSEVFEQCQIGYVSSDQYEVSRLKSMLDLRAMVRQRMEK